jgi:hypothetical protein
MLAFLSLSGLEATASTSRSVVNDPPRLVPWKKVGDIGLGMLKSRVQYEYGTDGDGFHVVQRYPGPLSSCGAAGCEQGYYVLHGRRVYVTFYGNRVGEIGFSTSYYRTSTGFGVGSVIPLGSCHKTSSNPCEYRWKGFVFTPRWHDSSCNCWIKVGVGPNSLGATGANFLKPWFWIYTSRGRVTGFYWALQFVD